jgi:ABC-2 type transport system ATP-binding protein
VPGITGEQYMQSLAPFYPDFESAAFDRYLREFNLPSREVLTKLSHGQQKKFLLSFGLACQSSLLVLDEPTNGLDIPSKGLFRRLVAEAVTDRRVFIISTHQVRDVESLIDPIVILHEGNMLFNRSMTEITGAVHMAHTTSRPEQSQSLLYSEPALGGYWSVWKGADEEGHIDLEVLFNTVVARPDLYASVFPERKVAT